MTLEIVLEDLKPGYAGSLRAIRNPALSNRFHFWRGLSGRRYACTKFPAHAAPAYDHAILLFVRRISGDPTIAAVATGAASIPPGIDEIHVHLVQDGSEALNFCLDDLAALIPAGEPHGIEHRCAA